MKKLLTIASVLAAFVLAAWAVGSLRWHPSRRPEPPRIERVAQGAGPLLAGAAELPISPPFRVPVAGFPRLSWMNQGYRDPVAVRALVLSEPGCSVALVSAEILLVPAELGRAVEKRLKDLRLDHIVLAATHTHSGPGGYWEEPLGQRIATGPYDGRVSDYLADRVAQVIRSAAAAREPALLAIAHAEVPALARNRSGAKVDGHLFAMRIARRSGKPLAQMVIYPAHATFLGVENRQVSGDWPGYLMRELGVPTLFFQGAMGDQSPQPVAEAHIPAPEAYARAIAARMAALSFPPADPWPPLSIVRATALLPAPEPGATPPLLRRVASNLFYFLAPARGEVAALRVGPATLLLVPGEPVAEVGRRWRALAGDGAEILSLAGDYLGYIETSERMIEKLGETVRTYYGPELADRLGAALAVAARAAREEAPPQDDGVLKRLEGLLPGVADAQNRSAEAGGSRDQ